MAAAPEEAADRLVELEAALREWASANEWWIIGLFVVAGVLAVTMIRHGLARGRDVPCGVSPPASGVLVALLGMACFLMIGAFGQGALARTPDAPRWLLPAWSLLAATVAVVSIAGALRRLGVGRRAVGLATPCARPAVFATAVYVLSLPGLAVASHFAREVSQTDAQEQVKALLGESDPVFRVLLFASVCIGAPVFEELLFRGLLLSSLRRWFGPVVAVVGSAIAFTLVHPSFTYLPIFWLGLVLGALYHYTGSLVAPIVLHALHNGLQFVWITTFSGGGA